MKFASMFTGAGGADCGARLAGLAPIWGVEINIGYAAIAQANGFDTMVTDATQVNFSELKRPDFLHASPPCQRASVANTKGGETGKDMELAQSVAIALEDLQPDYFTLENVAGYRNFRAYALIKEQLISLGYSIADGVLDAADFGVPQTRKRLWLVASRRAPASLPLPTHHAPEKHPGLFTDIWVGWHEALRDLPAPREARMSDRLVAALPNQLSEWHLATGFKNVGGCFERSLTLRPANMPSPTLTASMNRESLQPWLIAQNVHEFWLTKVLDVPHMAALQSFPADYQWGDNPTRAREAIGNSVAPLQMAEIVGALLNKQSTTHIRSLSET